MNDNRNFTPRLGQGDLPDIFDYAVLAQGNFERAGGVWTHRWTIIRVYYSLTTLVSVWDCTAL